MKSTKPYPSENGMIMLGALLVMTFFMVVAISVGEFSINHFNSAKRSLTSLDALTLAEAGGENFMYNINANTGYSGSGGAVTLYNDSVKGKGTYETSVTNGTIANEKVITSIGKIYLPATAATPKVTRTIKLIIEGSAPAPYTVNSGPGGLILGNNATLNNGPIYAGGYITMGNNATIGTSSQPTTVDVADYQCPSANPPGSTFPALCASAPPSPITFSTNSHIYGTVHENNGSSDAHMTSPGYTAGAVSAPSLPDPGRATVKATITTTMTAANANTCNSSYSTWNNVHITGNVSLPNNCTVTVTGNVWVDGNLTMSNNNTIKVGNSLGVAPQIMIDGSSGLTFGNNGILSSNTSGIGFYIVTYWNASGDPDATSLSGNNLYNSMYISNNRSNPNYTITTGSNGSASSGTVLYARWSGVSIGNNGSMGAIAGQIINFGNNGSITFNTGTSGSATTWNVRFYQQVFP